MRKKFLWVLLACVMAFSLAAFTACEADMTDEDTVRATGVTLNETSISLAVGEQFQLEATPTPADTTEDIRWSVVTTQTSGTNVAKVSPDGLVTAVSAGTATIQVQVGTAKATCEVTVTDNGGGTTDPSVTIELSQTSATLQVDRTVDLTATVTGAEASAVAWSVTEGTSYVSLSAASGATVTVTAVAAGNAVVTAAVGGVSATCEITVEAASQSTTTPLTFYKGGAEVSGDDLYAGLENRIDTASLTEYTDQSIDGYSSRGLATYESSWFGGTDTEEGWNSSNYLVQVPIAVTGDFTITYTADVYASATDSSNAWCAPGFIVTDGVNQSTTQTPVNGLLYIRSDGWTGLSSNAGGNVTLNQTIEQTVNTAADVWKYSLAATPSYIDTVNEYAYYEAVPVSVEWEIAYNATTHVFSVEVTNTTTESTFWSFTVSATDVTDDLMLWIGGQDTYMTNISGTITYDA